VKERAAEGKRRRKPGQAARTPVNPPKAEASAHPFQIGGIALQLEAPKGARSRCFASAPNPG